MSSIFVLTFYLNIFSLLKGSMFENQIDYKTKNRRKFLGFSVQKVSHNFSILLKYIKCSLFKIVMENR